MIFGLIPSRLASKRLNKKALIKIDGMPIIAHTFKRAKMARLLDDVIVCTDSKKIGNIIKKFKGKFKITSKNIKMEQKELPKWPKNLKSQTYY